MLYKFFIFAIINQLINRIPINIRLRATVLCICKNDSPDKSKVKM